MERRQPSTRPLYRRALFLEGKPFRAAGANIYWAGLDQNAENSSVPASVAYPDPFCVKDAFDTAALMGARIVRCHTCGISVGNPLSFEPALGEFNHSALRAVDFAVSQAAAHGIRLIVPLIDNWRYYHGGKHDFTDWLGIGNENEFFTAPKAVVAFKTYVAELLNHTNSITGVRYGSDPTVMVWETGNELMYNGGPPPTAWTEDIARLIKSLAPDHLVMDGTNGVNTAALPIVDVDVYSQHFYPGPSVLDAEIAAGMAAAAGKAFLVGEFGWKAATLAPFLAMAQSNANVSADLYWSLFPHRVDHGFVQHGDSFTLHFPDGDGNPAAVASLRAHAFGMSGEKAPPFPAPTSPAVTMVSDSAGIAWRGAAGAGNYTVQAQRPGSAAWTTVCDGCASDNGTPIPMPGGWSADDAFRVRGLAPDDSVPGPWSPPVSG